MKLKRRFALVFLRWIAVLMATYVTLEFAPGRVAVYLLVAVYIGASIFAEIAPDKFPRSMPGGAEDAEPGGTGTGGEVSTVALGSSKAASAVDQFRDRWRKRQR